MKLEPLGESAFIMRDLGRWDAFALSEAVASAGLSGVTEAVCAYDTLAVYVDPDRFSARELAAWFESTSPRPHSAFERHEIPVCYDMGEDLPAVADALGLSPAEVVRLHGSVDYRCYAVGFSPGFPYLGYLPEPLRGVPRLPSPRLRVPAGAVALTGDQTGVYPQATPGGWSLIGRTPLTLVDVAAGYFPVKAGDLVRFVSISADDFERRLGERLR